MCIRDSCIYSLHIVSAATAAIVICSPCQPGLLRRQHLERTERVHSKAIRNGQLLIGLRRHQPGTRRPGRKLYRWGVVVHYIHITTTPVLTILGASMFPAAGVRWRASLLIIFQEGGLPPKQPEYCLLGRSSKSQKKTKNFIPSDDAKEARSKKEDGKSRTWRRKNICLSCDNI